MFRSCESKFTARDLLKVFIPTCGGFALLFFGVQLLGELGGWPHRRSIVTIDETVFAHRREVAETSTADVVIVGDSSSAIDIEAPLLESLLPGEVSVVNQGLMMGLPLSMYAEPAAGIVAKRAGVQTHVVLLFTPKFLTRKVKSAYHVDLWNRLGRRSPHNQKSLEGHWFGGFIAGRELVIIPLFPWSTHGRAGTFWPNVYMARKRMVEHQGSRYDVGWYNGAQRIPSTAWVIQSNYIAEATQMRTVLGQNATLYLGLAPMPETVVESGYRALRDRMLVEIGNTMGADILLTNLPATMPNGFCATEAHLNQRGAEVFTRLLADTIAQHLDADPKGEKKP